MTMDREALEQALIARHGAENQKKFAAASVGIAGLGGLGSHIAVYLARLGVGRLVLADFDRVDVTNLNRQHYFIHHLGQYKTEALAEQLRQINPWLDYELHTCRVSADNACALFQGCQVVCEAFDQADQKAMLVQGILTGLPNTLLVAGSGMAGSGSPNAIRTQKAMSRLYLCGDGESDIDQGQGLMAPRVAVCAAHQAAMVMRLLLGQTEP
ncbi:thiamine biosynthesis protein ThiF [Flavonifractor sp. An82]|nr:sulfur carrier protein ThiS adenylyltransferase ThiF [Flavonifractor sp. An82]OUN22599.1 thiamine biosynthesis protein ThiF [Flavonifractor sp. An82]